MRCWPTSLKVLVGLGWARCLFPPGCRVFHAPVTPNATPAAVELLKFIYTISGQHTLSGQHNFPADKDKHTQAALNAWGKMPALFGKDWDLPNQETRTRLRPEQHCRGLKQQYQNGALVTCAARGAADG